MLSRSVRCWSTLFAEVAALGALGASSVAMASGVGIANKGGVAPNGIAYYAAGKGTAGNFVMDDGFGSVDVYAGQVSESGSLSNALSFEFFSDKTNVTALQSGQSYAVVVTTTQSSGSGVQAVAIAGTAPSGSNEVFCGGGAFCYTLGRDAYTAPNGSGSTLPYYYAVPYTLGSRIRLRLYPKDVCTSFYQQQNQAAVGCTPVTSDASYQTASIGGTAANMQLTFQLHIVDQSGALVGDIASPLDAVKVTLSFEDDQRTTAKAITCPSTISYYPSDSMIIADVSGLGPTVQGQPAGYAPLTQVLLVGKGSSGTPAVDASFLGNLLSRGNFGTEEPLGGFTNITSENDAEHTYGIAFLVRDAAGAVWVPGGTGCPMTGVQTSAIQGFLAKSNCFIATAAFRSIDAAPVGMLRAFRDQVLRRSEWGSSFVRWYYRWSPGAAGWLMDHAEFRYPVLQALIPVEVAAWLMLHPVQLTGLLIITASALVLGTVFLILLRVRERAGE